MKKSELRQIIKEEISELTAAAAKIPPTPVAKTGSVKGGSTSTLIVALKGIGIEDPDITTILTRLKNLKYKPTMSEKQTITNIFRTMMSTNDDTALSKVFSALKQMEA